jgi:hypothetical protein
MMFFKRVVTVLAAAVVGVGLVACDDDDGSSNAAALPAVERSASEEDLAAIQSGAPFFDPSSPAQEPVEVVVEELDESSVAELVEAQKPAAQGRCLTESQLIEELERLHDPDNPQNIQDTLYAGVQVDSELSCEEFEGTLWQFAKLIARDGGGMAILQLVNGEWVDHGGIATEPSIAFDELPPFIQEQFR